MRSNNKNNRRDNDYIDDNDYQSNDNDDIEDLN